MLLSKKQFVVPFLILGAHMPILQAQQSSAVILEEITVTAQRREQSIQDVPIAVTAFSEADIVNRQIGETLDIVPYIPNAVAQNNTGPGGANAYFIRGLGSAQSLATFDSPVSTYIDDMLVARQAANNFAFFDLERVEVLRGPQGTLFGRNTTGGAVRIILKKPAQEFGGFAEVGFGNYGRIHTRGSVDLPLSDNFLTKFSAYSIRDDGFVENRTTGEDVSDEDNWGVRGALRWLINEDDTWDFSLDYINNRNANNLNFDDNGDRFTLTGLPSSGGTFFSPITGDPLLTGSKNDEEVGSKAVSFSAQSNLMLDFDNYSVSIITAYLDTQQDLLVDVFNGGIGTLGNEIPGAQTSLPPGVRGSFRHATGGFAFAQFGDHQQFTQEIKISGSALDGSLDYVTGLFYFNEDNTTEIGQIFTVPSGFPLVLADFIFDNKTEAWAVYGQADYHLTEKLTLTAGFRYTDEEKDIAFRDLQPAGAPSDHTTANLLAAGIPDTQNTSLVTPRFAIQYEQNDDLMLFASATRGFKSGGWNASDTDIQRVLPFSDERVWSYETGIRSDWMDKRLRLNATAFYTDVVDFQILSALQEASGNLVFLTRNFADMEVKGLEFEASMVVTDHLNINASLGLQNAEMKIDRSGPEFDQFGVQSVAAQQRDCLNGVTAACDSGIVKADGSIADPTRSPDVTASVGFNYEYPVDSLNGNLIFNVNALYFEDHPRGVSNAPLSFTGNVVTVNASLGYRSEDDRLSLMAQCKNCTDEAYTISTVGPLAWINDPVRWELNLRYKFGAH